MAQEAIAHGAAQDAVVTPLLIRTISDPPASEVVVMTVDYAAGDVDALDRLHAQKSIYVLEGSIEMGLQDGRVVTLHPGQTFHESPNDIHTVARNASKVWPAKALVVLVRNRGVNAVAPVK